MSQDQPGRTPAALQAAAGPRLSSAEYGSDVIVEMLRETGIPYVALNPGASFRGIHDSLVNFGHGQPPEIILCTHEEVAVAMAHGYARVTGRPMAAALHDIVGLQHATMAIFNAWCDRVPMLLLGGTGPMDSDKRRPWIDWVHTALVQGNQVRDYVKWDDQPASVEAFPESLLRAYRLATTEPQGPVYVCFDATLQEQEVGSPVQIPDARRFASPVPPAAGPRALREAASLLVQARFPLIVADNAGRSPEAVPALQSLAELLGCGVVDIGGYFNFPSGHVLDVTAARPEALARADVILALDVNDLASALAARAGRDRVGLELALPPEARSIHVTRADYLQHSWASDVQKLMPVDIPIAASAASVLPDLIALCAREIDAGGGGDAIGERRRQVQELQAAVQRPAARPSDGAITRPRLYREMWSQIAGSEWSLVNGPYAQLRSTWEFTQPQQFAGANRGAG